MTAAPTSLDVLVFLGSVRDSAPPRPRRLGARVAAACEARLRAKGHAVSLVDPLAIDRPERFKPHFAHADGQAPAGLESLAKRIEQAEGYVMVSPEYNHAMSPALADLLNHFGSSLFSYKPSAIVTYSAGQWGGARAAVGMRTFLGELGCLPVSAMVHVPKAQEVFAADGTYADGVAAAAWNSYIDRTLDQLIWWAGAARAHRDVAETPAAFRREPSQRNAP